MIKTDIEKIQLILSADQQNHLVDLLTGCDSFLNVTSTYGSKSFSLKSTFDIKYPIRKGESFNKLTETDKKKIFNAVLKVYPIQDGKPEIIAVEYIPNVDDPAVDIVETADLKAISFEYIQEQIQKCESKMGSSDFEGAVTNARNLLESICIYIIETETGQPHSSDGNLKNLFKIVCQHLNLNASDQVSSNIKQLIAGCTSIITASSSLRNNNSDSHGSGPLSIELLNQTQSEFVINQAFLLSKFLYKTYLDKKDGFGQVSMPFTI